MATDRDAVTLTVTEPRDVPPESLVLAAAAMLPFPAGAALAILGGGWGEAAATLTVLWGAAVLCFLAGVRRGVSFRMPGGPTASQLALMFALFCLGAGALLVVAVPLGTALAPPLAIAAGLLAAGYGVMLVADPIGAQRGTMPAHFARLRPVQMLVPTLSLAAIAAVALAR